MSDTAAIEEVAQAAAELRQLPREAIIDVNERVHRDQRIAGRLERAVEVLIRAATERRRLTPRTTRPAERRSMVVGPKGRVVVVESRG